MDCEGCTDRLIDLLYGGIDDADAEATRAHLGGCEACRGAFERISAGHELATMLVIEEPPPSVFEAVMAAASERAGRVSAKPEPASQVVQVVPREASEGDDDDGGLWSSLVRWMGSFAMGPQVAMATMLLLMVGIGLWYLPDWRGTDPTDTHAIVDPAAGDEVGPSAGLVPAEPLALEEDPRRARIRPRGEEPTEPVPRSRPAAASDTPAPERQASALRGQPRDQGGAALVEQQAQEGRALDEAAQERAPGPAPDPMPTPELAIATAEPIPGSREPTPATAGASAPRAFAQPPPQAMAPQAPAGAALADRAEPSSPDMLPPALHQLARNQATANTCPQAIRTYERLLARYPSYPRASEARVELADCYRRTGRLTQARRSLETASRDPRISSRAQRELVRLEAAERAMDRQRTETERTPDPPAARSADSEALEEPTY